jgi:hypothetical protein
MGFQTQGKGVFPLALGAVFVGGFEPERSEFQELVRIELALGETESAQDAGEGFFAGRPSLGHRELRSRVGGSVVRAPAWWWWFYIFFIFIFIFICRDIV